jgi:hypothetical protein
VVGRANYAAAVVEGRGIGLGGQLDALGLARRRGREGDVIGFFAELFMGAEPGDGWRGRIASALGSPQTWNSESARQAVALILVSPEAQLG